MSTGCTPTSRTFWFPTPCIANSKPTNETLAHAFVADFENAASIVYTAETPIKDPALYNQALELMNLHLSSNPQAIPSLPSMG